MILPDEVNVILDDPEPSLPSPETPPEACEPSESELVDPELDPDDDTALQMPQPSSPWIQSKYQ